jgi:uncharacterized protein (TIRG00374 family)
MSSKRKILLAAVLGLAVVIYAALRIGASEDWQQFRMEDVWRSFRGLHLSYLLLAAAMIFASYLFRCFRWREFLRPMKVAGMTNLIVGTLVGFSAVALLGRPGEVLRPWLIARKEGLTVASQAAAWTLERVFDSLTVSGFLGLALYFASSRGGFPEGHEALLENFRRGGLLLFAGAVALGIAVGQFRRRSHLIRSLLERLDRPLPHAVQVHLEKMAESFAGGLAGIATLRSLAVCAAYSWLVWLSILVAFWSVFQALGDPVSRLGLSAAVLVIVATIVGSVAHLPGVGGGQQVAIALTLNRLFEVPLAMAATAALLLWALSFMMVLIPGLPLTAHEGLTWQRLRSVAKEEL